MRPVAFQAKNDDGEIGGRPIPQVGAAHWLSSYQRAWLRVDFVAGLTLAAYLLPAGIADASLAGLPSEAGIYACVFSGLVFWLFCSSRHTVITVTSGLSLLIGSSIGELSGGDPARHAALAACAALMTGVIALAAAQVRAGHAVAFFSETVFVGFKAGLALYMTSTQVPKLLGFKGASGDFWDRSAHILRHLGDTHVVSMIVGLAALLFLVTGKVWLKNRPVAFIVVVLGILATGMFGLDARGVALLGPVPQGLPMPGLPDVTRADLNALMPIAFACFVMGAVESFAIGRMFGEKHGNRLDANQELVALGAANLAAGLGRGFPVSGGMSQSLVNESAGARTPLSGLIAALFTAAVALFASGLLRNLPQPVLAAIIISAAIGLFKLDALRRIRSFSRIEFAVAIAALIGVLGSGPVNGVLIGAAISIVLLLRAAARPRVTELARIPQTADKFSDLARDPDHERIPGVLIVRCEASLLYFNVDHVRERLFDLLQARTDPIRLVVFSLGTVPRVDLAGARILADLHETLAARGVRFKVAAANGEVRDALRRTGFEKIHGVLETGQTIASVIADSEHEPATVPSGA
jgi:high affinity sulfate transporter 1